MVRVPLGDAAWGPSEPAPEAKAGPKAEIAVTGNTTIKAAKKTGTLCDSRRFKLLSFPGQSYAPAIAFSGSARPRHHRWELTVSEPGWASEPGRGSELERAWRPVWESPGLNWSGPQSPGEIQPVRCRWWSRLRYRHRRCVRCADWSGWAERREPEIRRSCRSQRTPCRSARSAPPSARRSRSLRATRDARPRPRSSTGACSRRTRRRTRLQRCRSCPPPRSSRLTCSRRRCPG